LAERNLGAKRGSPGSAARQTGSTHDVACPNARNVIEATPPPDVLAGHTAKNLKTVAGICKSPTDRKAARQV